MTDDIAATRIFQVLSELRSTRGRIRAVWGAISAIARLSSFSPELRPSRGTWDPAAVHFRVGPEDRGVCLAEGKGFAFTAVWDAVTCGGCLKLMGVKRSLTFDVRREQEITP